MEINFWEHQNGGNLYFAGKLRKELEADRSQPVSYRRYDGSYMDPKHGLVRLRQETVSLGSWKENLYRMEIGGYVHRNILDTLTVTHIGNKRVPRWEINKLKGYLNPKEEFLLFGRSPFILSDEKDLNDQLMLVVQEVCDDLLVPCWGTEFVGGKFSPDGKFSMTPGQEGVQLFDELSAPSWAGITRSAYEYLRMRTGIRSAFDVVTMSDDKVEEVIGKMPIQGYFRELIAQMKARANARGSLKGCVTEHAAAA